MRINAGSKIPPSNILKISRDGIRREIERRRSPKALKKLEVIYNELTFLIENT